MDIERAGDAQHSTDDRTIGELLPPAALRRAEHQLRAPLGAREVDEGCRDVVAHNFVVGAAELFQQLRWAARWSSSAFGARPSPTTTRTPRSSPLVRVAMRAARRMSASPLGAPGDRDDNTLTCLPRVSHAVIGQVLLQRVFDPVGDPQQCELAKRAEVARSEVVGERGVDAFGGVDVAMGHAPAQCLRAHVDQLDLVRRPDERVGHGLALRHTGDPRDDIVQ